MENNINQEQNNNIYSPSNNNYYSEIGFTGKTLFFLNETGKWSKYYSWFSIFLYGLAILIMLISATTLAFSVPNWGLFLSLLLVAASVLFASGLLPVWFLMRSSNKIKKGLHHEFLPDILSGIDDLASFFKVYGIIAVIMIVVMVIGFCLFLIFQGSISTMLPNMKTMV